MSVSIMRKCVCARVSSLVDRIVQEQCCLSVLEDNMCSAGINMAKNQGACDSLFNSTCETKTTKVCLNMSCHVYVCVKIQIIISVRQRM